MPQETCYRHKRKHAAYRCQQCAKPICDKCTFNTRFCGRACNEKYSDFVEGYERPVRRGGGIGMGRVLLALLVTAAIVGGIWYAKTNGMF